VCRPQRQAYGSANLVDDQEIEDKDRVIRHCRTPVQIVDDALTGGKKISSQAFKARAGEGCSVDLECLLTHVGLNALSRCGVMPDTYAMVALKAGEARAIGAGIAYTPKPQDALPANDFHGDIFNIGKKSKALMQGAEILVVQGEPFPRIDEPAHGGLGF
jgi:hypothetical protein